jgi:predicted small lipoprotein YifL
MKKMFAIMIAAVMLLALAACGESTSGSNAPQQNTTSNPVESSSPATPAANNTPVPSEPVQQTAAGGIAPATDGTLTISAADIAIVVNGTSVPMPYNLKALEAAGVPADESRSEIELGAGDFFSANLYLDENEDYLLIPAYYNGGDNSISITEAEAEEITMTTYADELKDQGVSIFGVSFGMPRSEVKALIGEPDYDSGDYCEWHIEVSDIAYEGTLSMYFTEDADDAGVSQVDLTVFEK